MVFFVAIFALLVAASLRFSPHGFLDCLSMDSSKSLRGICTFAIIIHHFSQSFGEKSILTTVFLGVGYLSVAVFFFFSGYGLMKSFQLKPDYQNSFLSRRFLTILIPYCFFILLYWAVNSLFGTSYSVSDILISLLVGHPVADITWYLVVTLYFYLAFYFMMRFSKGNGRRIFLSSLIWCVLWATLFIALKWDTYWYNSCFCICLGVFTATKEEEILGIIKNHYLPALTISALVFLVNVFCSLFIAKNEFTKFLFSGLGSIFFVITVLILLMKVRIRNKMWSFLSEISLEVYLIHPLYMKLLRNDYLSISNNIIWGLAVIALTVPTAYWLHLLLSKVASLVRKLR